MVAVPVAFALAGSGTASDAPPQQVIESLAGNRQGLILGGVVVVAVAALVLWFGATLSWLVHVRDRESPVGLVVLAGSVVMVVFLMLDGVFQVAVAFLATQPGPAAAAAVPALFVLQNGIVMPGAFGFAAAVFLSAVGVAALRRVFAAVWVGYLSIALAALSVIGGWLGLSQLDGGGSSPLSFSPALGMTLITVVSSVYLLRPSGPVVISRTRGRWRP
jgi:hypothetical protein